MEHLVLEIPALIKSKTTVDGRRLVEVEASNESVDSEGDIITQQSLLDAAADFVKSGNLDIDHISEIGDRYGIPNPTSYIVGRPTEVKDLGDGRTAVIGEIRRSKDGTVDPKINKFDEFWESLNSKPPVNWRASIYGFPKSDGLIDCTRPTPGVKTYGATRYLVTGIIWRSLAFTRNPINDAITGTARVLTQKAFHEIMKSNLSKTFGGPSQVGGPVYAPSYPYSTPGAGPSPDIQASGTMPTAPPTWILPPRNREELIGHFHGHIRKGSCLFANSANGHSVYTFRQHFANCCGMADHDADILALALMQLLKHEKR